MPEEYSENFITVLYTIGEGRIRFTASEEMAKLAENFGKVLKSEKDSGNLDLYTLKIDPAWSHKEVMDSLIMWERNPEFYLLANDIANALYEEKTSTRDEIRAMIGISGEENMSKMEKQPIGLFKEKAPFIKKALKKPEMKCKILIVDVQPGFESYSIDFYAPLEIVEQVKSFSSSMKPRPNQPDRYLMYVDHRYDISEVANYIESLG